MPLSTFTWSNLTNVIHSFILPKAIERQALETKSDLCPQGAHKTVSMRVHSWTTDY